MGTCFCLNTSNFRLPRLARMRPSYGVYLTSFLTTLYTPQSAILHLAHITSLIPSFLNIPPTSAFPIPPFYLYCPLMWHPGLGLIVSSQPVCHVREDPVHLTSILASCSELLGTARSCSELLGAARSCSELLGAAQPG